MAHFYSKNHLTRRELSREKNQNWELPHTFLIELEGAIIDSAALHYRIYLELLKNSNIPGSKIEFQNFFGLPIEDFIHEVNEAHDLRKSLPALVESYQYSFGSLISSGMPALFPGSRDFFQIASLLGLTIGLVAIQGQATTRTLLKEFELETLIDGTISADNEEMSNPYQALLASFGSQTEDSICIAYSQQGVEKARESGSIVWQFQPQANLKTHITVNRDFLKFSDWSSVVHFLQERYSL